MEFSRKILDITSLLNEEFINSDRFRKRLGRVDIDHDGIVVGKIDFNYDKEQHRIGYECYINLKYITDIKMDAFVEVALSGVYSSAEIFKRNQYVNWVNQNVIQFIEYWNLKLLGVDCDNW